MANDDLGLQAMGDRLYADAVCAQCGTVNPEGTLICKTCGNNLRDQRTLRLAAEQVLADQVSPISRRQVFLGLLTLFGILLVLWVALNVDTITNWLIATQSDTPNPRTLWAGSDQDMYGALLTQLEESNLSDVDKKDALTNFDKGEDADGVYVLARETPLGQRVVGTAFVKVQDDVLYFAALVGENAEVRGKAIAQGNNGWAVNWNSSGALVNNRYFAVTGVALHRPEGMYDCFGQSENSDDEFAFSAYKVPNRSSQ
jgi:hypothetical protein